jgi:hypothetical protein
MLPVLLAADEPLLRASQNSSSSAPAAMLTQRAFCIDLFLSLRGALDRPMMPHTYNEKQK